MHTIALIDGDKYNEHCKLFTKRNDDCLLRADDNAAKFNQSSDDIHWLMDTLHYKFFFFFFFFF